MRALLGMGILALFAGVIVFSVSNQYTETLENQLVKRAENLDYGKWKITAPFDKNEKIFVAFKGPNLEGIPDGTSQAIATIWVNITNNPEVGNTTFRVDFRRVFSPLTQKPSAELNVTLESNNGGLDVDFQQGMISSPEDIGGVTQSDGNYTAYVYTYNINIARYYYPPSSTLAYLEFFQVVANREYPFGSALPVGVALIVGGVFSSIWAVRSSGRSSKKRGKRGKK